MLQNAYFVAKIGADTAENEQHFAEILPIGRRVADRPTSPPGAAPRAAVGVPVAWREGPAEYSLGKTRSQMSACNPFFSSAKVRTIADLASKKRKTLRRRSR